MLTLRLELLSVVAEITCFKLTVMTEYLLVVGAQLYQFLVVGVQLY